MRVGRGLEHGRVCDGSTTRKQEREKGEAAARDCKFQRTDRQTDRQAKSLREQTKDKYLQLYLLLGNSQKDAMRERGEAWISYDVQHLKANNVFTMISRQHTDI